MSKHNSIFSRGTSIIALAVATASVAPSAFAQAAAAPTRSEEIVVTGSHLGRSAFNAPTPVNVIGDERMKALGNPSLADTLNQIPSFRPITSPTSNSFRVFGNIGARSMDLRGLGVTRTLVLLDGKRVVPSSDNGSVDLNAIPSSLVKRTEVVTGGASAAYGADAVAGVVNIILDNRFTGYKVDVNSGIADAGDGQNYFASVAAGQDFAGGRGHWIFGAEAQKERGILGCAKRDFCDKHTNYPGNAGWNANPALSNGLPNTLVRDNVEFTYSLTPNIQSYTGVTINSSGQAVAVAKGQQLNSATQMATALKNTGINPTTLGLTPFVYGANLNGTFMIGGDANFNANDRAAMWGFSSNIVTPTEHFSTLGHVDFDVTDRVQASAELLYSTVTGYTYGGSAGIFTPTMKLTSGQNGLGNPFIPAAVRAALIAADPSLGASGTSATGARVDSSISLNVTKPETGRTNAGTSYNDTVRAVFGLKGDLDTHDMKWDVSYEYGKTTGQVKVTNARLAVFDGSSGAPYNALDAVTPPTGYTGPIYYTASGAQVICAQSVINTNQYNGNGCIPVNPLGTNSLTPEVLNKYFKPEWAKRIETQDAAAANLSGTLFDGWAGAITGAVGAEWRRDQAEGAADPLTLAGVFQSANVSALGAVDRTVKEAYVEVSIPLLQDLPFAKNLTIDGQKRWTNYSTSGDAQTYKAGLVYEPDDQIMVRLTTSQDIRAPTAFELNPNPVTVLLPLPNPFNGRTENILAKTVGNPNLENEQAYTTTAGLVLKPSFLPGFRVSTDYYDITVRKAIDALTAAPLMQACKNQNLLCNFIFDASGNPVTQSFTGTPSLVTAQYINGAKLHAEGAELVASYSFNALGGTFDASFNGNYIMDLKSVGPTGLKVRLDGVTGNLGAIASIQGVPQYKLDGLLTYTHDNWSVTGHARYIPEGILDQGKVGPEDGGYSPSLSTSIETNRVDSATYFDLSGTYSPKLSMFGGKTQIYASVNNVFDQSEPNQLRLLGNGVQFDPYGRTYRLGIRANW